MRGRKPKQESRGDELRGKLAAWRQTPQSARPSLRTLARDLGTSHQLLSHYLQHSEKWQAEEQEKAYQQEAKKICARAEAENRPMTLWEKERVPCHRKAFQLAMGAVLNDWYRKLRRQAERGQLSAGDLRTLRFLTRRGKHQAQEILHLAEVGVAEVRKEKVAARREKVATLKRAQAAEMLNHFQRQRDYIQNKDFMLSEKDKALQLHEIEKAERAYLKRVRTEIAQSLRA